LLGAQAVRASQQEFASGIVLCSNTNLPDREHPLTFVRNFGSYLATQPSKRRTSVFCFVIRWLELSSPLALHGNQAEKRVIFSLEQFPGDLAVWVAP